MIGGSSIDTLPQPTTFLFQARLWRLVLIPIGTEFVTMFMSADSGDDYLFLSSSMNFKWKEPWGMFAARWYLWMLSGLAIYTFKTYHCPPGLKWLGCWNMLLIYGAVVTGYKQDHAVGQGYSMGIMEILHLVFGLVFLVTCWVETCTVWFPNTIFTVCFGILVFGYIALYTVTEFVVPIETGIPYIEDHHELVAQHLIVIVAYVTQCITAPDMHTPEWKPRSWACFCCCTGLGSSKRDVSEVEPQAAPDRIRDEGMLPPECTTEKVEV